MKLLIGWFGHKRHYTQEEISSPIGFVIILASLIIFFFLLRWMIFGKDAKKKFLSMFPRHRIKDPDMQYLVSVFVLIVLEVFLFLALLSSIFGVGWGQ